MPVGNVYLSTKQLLTVQGRGARTVSSDGELRCTNHAHRAAINQRSGRRSRIRRWSISTSFDMPYSRPGTGSPRPLASRHAARGSLFGVWLRRLIRDCPMFLVAAFTFGAFSYAYVNETGPTAIRSGDISRRRLWDECAPDMCITPVDGAGQRYVAAGPQSSEDFPTGRGRI